MPCTLTGEQLDFHGVRNASNRDLGNASINPYVAEFAVRTVTPTLDRPFAQHGASVQGTNGYGNRVASL